MYEEEYQYEDNDFINFEVINTPLENYVHDEVFIVKSFKNAETQTGLNYQNEHMVGVSERDHSCYISDFSDECVEYFSLFLKHFYGKLIHFSDDAVVIDKNIIHAKDNVNNFSLPCQLCSKVNYQSYFDLQSTGWNQFVGRHIIIEKFLHTPKCNPKQKKYYQPRLVVHEFSGTKGKNNQKCLTANLVGVTINQGKISLFFQIPQSYNCLKHSFYFNFNI